MNRVEVAITVILFGFALAPVSLAGTEKKSHPIHKTMKEEHSDQCVKGITIGMTRGEVEAKMSHDGGLCTTFLNERYIVPPGIPGKDGKVLKVNVTFKPARMSDKDYERGEWRGMTQSKNDVVLKISAPYREFPYSD